MLTIVVYDKTKGAAKITNYITCSWKHKRTNTRSRLKQTTNLGLPESRD